MAKRRNVEWLIVLQPIAADTASPDHEGMLVSANGLLVAVLVRLDDKHETSDCWLQEAPLGRFRVIRTPPFANLECAARGPPGPGSAVNTSGLRWRRTLFRGALDVCEDVGTCRRCPTTEASHHA